MKKILNNILVVIVFTTYASCSKIDNYEEPDASLQGAIIDITTGELFKTESGSIDIQLEELSWNDTPTPQHIPSKFDGTYEDTQLFSGHYLVTPVNGPFWPIAEGIEIDINKGHTQDFELTPYLKIINLTHTLDGTTLTMRFNLDAPITSDLPQIIDIQPFVNISSYVGSGGTISQYTDPNRLEINSNWSDEIAAMTYELQVTDLKPGRTFYARVGARVNDSYKKFNYSDIIEIQVP